MPKSVDGIDPTNISRWGKVFLEQPDAGLAMLHRHASDLLESNPIVLATWANYFGDPELALEAYRRSPREVQAILGVHLWLPLYSEMRKRPAFRILVRDLGFVDTGERVASGTITANQSAMRALFVASATL